MEIELSKLNFTFSTRPLLIGGKAMEYYGLRKAGADIDFVVTPQDYNRLVRQFPAHRKDLWGDLGICVYEFEIWKSICLFDYAFLSAGAVEQGEYLIISLEKLLFLKALGMKEEKYRNDLALIVERLIGMRYQQFYTPQTYYASVGRMTDPKEQASWLDDLPNNIGELCKILQGVMLHIFWAERYGVKLSQERQQEVNWRSIIPKLQRIQELDDRPLCASRPLEKRVVGNCRDFSTLLCAFLRHQSIPARARCGFAKYFTPGHYEDHWVTEYWNAAEKRWVLVDAQLDGLMIAALKIDFNTLDVPRDQFIVAGQAWQLCRSGQADPNDFGIFDMKGLWFIRGNVIRDFLAFNRVEILPWDGGWGIMAEPEGEADTALIDRLAALTVKGDEAFSEIRGLYEGDERIRIPAEWEPAL